MKFGTFAVSFVVLSALAACSSSSSKPATTTSTNDAGGSNLIDGGNTSLVDSGGTPDGGGTTSNEDGGTVCNTIANAATAITLQTSSGTPPTATGGTIADGTYYLTAGTLYLAADSGISADAGVSFTDQTTLQLSGGVAQIVSNVNDSGSSTSTSTITTSGTSIIITDTCPDTKVNTGTFSVSGSTFSVYSPSDGYVEELTFTKQ